MVTWEKYARNRHKPDSEWVQTTFVEKVVGVEYRKPDAFAFARAAKKAEQQGCVYGVRLELEPDNLVDENAIMVWGVAENKGWLGGIKQAEWHIGYLSAELAAEIHRDIIDAGAPIAAELYNIFENGDYLDFSIIVLAQMASAFRRGRKPLARKVAHLKHDRKRRPGLSVRKTTTQQSISFSIAAMRKRQTVRRRAMALRHGVTSLWPRSFANWNCEMKRSRSFSDTTIN